MGPILIELSPNRLLLDSNFDGYKLSLQELPTRKRDLEKPVDRIRLNTQQYTLLHTKLYALHNHLVGRYADERDSIYFIDTDWNVCLTYLDPFTDGLVEPVKVWQVPKTRNRLIGDYNVTLKFVDERICVIADGAGTMHILDTGEENLFTLLFSDKVIASEEGFTIVDATTKKIQPHKELHVLLLNIKQEDESEKYCTFLHWVTFVKSDGQWQQTSLKQLKVKGEVQYSALEKDCEAVYVVSDGGAKFTINSDCPVKIEGKPEQDKAYQWSQNSEEINIKFYLSGNLNKDLLSVKSDATNIEVIYNENKLLSGALHQRTDPDLTTWTVESDHIEVTLSKQEPGVMWSEFVRGDTTGEYVLDTCIVEEVHQRLGRLCSDIEDSPQTGATFNSQQVEDCDFETDKTFVFERLKGSNNEVTHKVHLGSHQVLLSADLSRGTLPSALGIRYDVDVCLWQPQGHGNDCSMSHEGTLLAFGYIQASKQNRKFCVCSPDTNFSAICESTGHIFIYRKQRTVDDSELRHRTTGRRIGSIAEQQVVNIYNEEVIGVHATNKALYILCEHSVRALKLCN